MLFSIYYNSNLGTILLKQNDMSDNNTNLDNQKDQSVLVIPVQNGFRVQLNPNPDRTQYQGQVPTELVFQSQAELIKFMVSHFTFKCTDELKSDQNAN